MRENEAFLTFLRAVVLMLNNSPAHNSCSGECDSFVEHNESTDVCNGDGVCSLRSKIFKMLCESSPYKGLKCLVDHIVFGRVLCRDSICPYAF